MAPAFPQQPQAAPASGLKRSDAPGVMHSASSVYLSESVSATAGAALHSCAVRGLKRSDASSRRRVRRSVVGRHQRRRRRRSRSWSGREHTAAVGGSSLGTSGFGRSTFRSNACTALTAAAWSCWNSHQNMSSLTWMSSSKYSTTGTIMSSSVPLSGQNL